MLNKIFELKLKHLVKYRLHLGHNEKMLHRKMNSYSFNIRHKLVILDLRKTIWSLNYLFFNLTNFFYYRNNIFFIETEGKIPLKTLIENLESNSFFLSNNFLQNCGYVQQKWVKGLLSNWKITSNLFKMKNKKKNFLRNLRALEGVKTKLNKPLLPDMLFLCNIDDKWGLNEIMKSKIPIFGLNDSNMNPDFFLYPIFGNNDSIESIKFCFSLFMLSQKESMFQERKFLYYMILLKIKTILSK